MREWIKILVLLIAMLALIALFAQYTWRFYQQCNGAVVRGVIGYACVATNKED